MVFFQIKKMNASCCFGASLRTRTFHVLLFSMQLTVSVNVIENNSSILLNLMFCVTNIFKVTAMLPFC